VFPFYGFPIELTRWESYLLERIFGHNMVKQPLFLVNFFRVDQKLIVFNILQLIFILI